MAMRENALNVYGENESTLHDLLDKVSDRLVLVAGLGGGIGCALTTRLVQEAVKRKIFVNVCASWVAPWEHERRKANCRWADERLKMDDDTITLDIVDPEPLLIKYYKTRESENWSESDFRKLWDKAIMERIVSCIVMDEH